MIVVAYGPFRGRRLHLHGTGELAREAGGGGDNNIGVSQHRRGGGHRDVVREEVPRRPATRAVEGRVVALRRRGELRERREQLDSRAVHGARDLERGEDDHVLLAQGVGVVAGARGDAAHARLAAEGPLCGGAACLAAVDDDPLVLLGVAEGDEEAVLRGNNAEVLLVRVALRAAGVEGRDALDLPELGRIADAEGVGDVALVEVRCLSEGQFALVSCAYSSPPGFQAGHACRPCSFHGAGSPAHSGRRH